MLRSLGFQTGTLIANPVPLAHEIPHEHIAPAIETALAEMEATGVNAKDVTPRLLARILELTEGASLRTNIELVSANARLAGEIAVALAGPGH